jgi:hypothetical protein
MLLICAKMDAFPNFAWHQPIVCGEETHISALSPQSVVIESLVASVR